MTIIAEVVGDNANEIKVVEVDTPFDITKVNDKICVTKDGKYILTKVSSLEIFESGVCIRKISWANKALRKE